jgi:hypothetical protein
MLSRGYFACASGKAGSRVTVRMTRTPTLDAGTGNLMHLQEEFVNDHRDIRDRAIFADWLPIRPLQDAKAKRPPRVTLGFVALGPSPS